MTLNKNGTFREILNHKFLVLFFFIIYLIVGMSVATDYGIGFDENMQRDIAQNRMDYISKFFSDIFAHSNNKYANSPIIKWPEYGVVFEVPALWLEKFFAFSDTQSQYFFRHYLIFLTSFIGSIFFYFLAFKRFNSWKIALLGTIFLISSPRIFAASFYNGKDIIFMYFFLINTFFAIIFLEKPQYSNAILLSFVSALCIGVRVIGFLLPFLTLFFLWIKYMRKDYNFKIKKFILTFLIFLIFFVILFWPSLWESPFKSFINAIVSFKSYDHTMFNFYLGKYTHSTTVHWFYIPLWIVITTPIIILIFFIYGGFFSVRRIFTRLSKINYNNNLIDLWRGPTELQDLIFISIVFLPVFMIIILGSTLYSGWRHLYFIYPYIILIALYGLQIIYNKFHILKIFTVKKLFNLVIFVFVILNFYWLYNSHPFQNTYFNFLAGKKPHNNFQVDSWGLANKFVLEKILNEDKRQKISISAISDTSLGQNFNILSPAQKNRLIYSGDLKNNDYIINSNNFLSGDYRVIKKIPNNFEIYYELFVDDILVTTIYKRNNSL